MTNALWQVMTYDDSLLESGNRESKDSKKIIFWGGTNAKEAFFEQIYFVDETQVDDTHRKVKTGNVVEQKRTQARSPWRPSRYPPPAAHRLDVPSLHFTSLHFT